jgi:hypothetical protein
VILDLRGTKLGPDVVGTARGARGGARSIAEGRDVRADDEIVLDSVMANRHDITLGERIDVMGASFRVVGLSSDTAGFMTSYVFTTYAATGRLFAASGTTSYVLVGASDPAAVRERLVAAGFNTLAADEVAANAEEVASGIFSGPLRLMVIVAFAAGTLVIALTAYTAIDERRREYGIVKALGARRGRLVAMAVTQTLVLALLGLTAGGVLFLGAARSSSPPVPNSMSHSPPGPSYARRAPRWGWRCWPPSSPPAASPPSTRLPPTGARDGSAGLGSASPLSSSSAPPRSRSPAGSCRKATPVRFPRRLQRS